MQSPQNQPGDYIKPSETSVSDNSRPRGIRSPSETEPEVSTSPPPGQQALVLAGVIIGILLLGVQLWLLTVALDLYLAGADTQGAIWFLPILSGLIFGSGLLLWLMLRKQQRLRR